MKKTLTINLGGTVYHIDEDAYRLLEEYLSNLRIYFRKEEGAEEIVKDIELRISELFSERVKKGYQVISIDYVEEVIARMGKPEEMISEEEQEKDRDSENKEQFEKQKSSENLAGKERIEVKRRLFRNPDNKVLGGVASGIAAYFGWDPTWVRVAFIVCIFIPYIPIILLYLLAWIVMPEARTAADKLAMCGESVTIENIGKTVTGGFEKVSNGMNDYIHSGHPRSTLQKIGDFFVEIIGMVLKVLFVILIILCSPVLFVLVIVFIVLILAAFGAMQAGPAFLLHQWLPSIDWSAVGTLPMALGSMAGVLLVSIPLGSLIYMALCSFFHWKPMSNGWKWSLLILWLIAFIGSAFFCYWLSVSIPHWEYII